jgi:competence protein ComEA
MRPAARLVFVALSIAPTLLGARPGAPPAACAEEGRGAAPRSWMGCAADPGAPRDLQGDELLLLGRPLDPNCASARELAFLPGLTAALAAEVVAERLRGGPFRSVEDLLRVDGIGPRRLAKAAPSLVVRPAPGGVAQPAE